MDASLVWRGDAVAVAQVMRVTPGAVVAGRDYSLRINFKDITVQGASAVLLVAAFVDAIDATEISEWREITAEADGSTLVLTSKSAGVPFVVSALVEGFELRAAVVVTIANTPSGGTWTFDAGEVDTGGYGSVDFDYDASVAEIQTELDALFGAGNTLVSRKTLASPARVVNTIEFIGSMAGKAVVPITVDGTALTGGTAAVVVTTEQTPVVGTSEVQTVTCFGSPTGGTRGFRFDGFTATVAYNASTADVQTAFRALPSVNGANVDVTGTANSEYVFTFKNALAHQALPLIEVITSELTGGTIYADLVTTTPGVAAVNQINYVYHRSVADTPASISLAKSGTWTSGTWKIKRNGGAFSGDIPWDATDSEIAAILETWIDLHGVIVTITSGYIAIGFVGPALTLPLSSVTLSVSLGGGSLSVSHFQSGEFVGGPLVDQTYKIRINGTWTDSIARDADVADVQTAVTAVSGAGTAIVTALENSGNLNDNDGLYQIEWRSSLSGAAVAVTVADDGPAGYTSIMTAIYQQATASGTNEVKTLTVHGSPSYGSVTLTYGGLTTTPVDYNATAAVAISALVALGNIGETDFVGAGGPLPGTAVTFTAGGALSYTDVGEMTVDDNGLKQRVVRTTPGVTGVNEIQRLSLAGQSVRAGTVTITIEGDAVDPVAYDVDLLTLIAALEDSSGLTAGDLAGSYGGPWPEEDFYIVFGGSMAETNADLITASDSLTNAAASAVSYDPMIVSLDTAATGPNHFNDPVNWYNPAQPTVSRAPERGDTLYWTEGTVDVLYGLVQMLTYTADTVNDLLVAGKRHDLAEGQVVEVWSIGGGAAPPAGLSANTAYYVVGLDPVTGNFSLATSAGGAKINLTGTGTGTHWVGVRVSRILQLSTYTGKWGLPWKNAGDYKEYRPLDLEIGLLPGGTKTITIGQGDGIGSGLISVYTGPDEVIFECLNSGSPSDRTRPAVNWRGSNADAVMKVLDGDFGIALRPTEAAVFDTLEQRGGSLSLGESVSFTTLDKTGGTITSINGATLSGPLKIRG